MPPARFELATPRSSAECSPSLSYSGIVSGIISMFWYIINSHESPFRIGALGNPAA